MLVSTSCDFDRGLCDGWRQSNSDVFDWTRLKGTTPSFPYTGPSKDHTSMSGKGNISHHDNDSLFFFFLIQIFTSN